MMKTATLAQFGEDALVRRLTKALPLGADVVAGAGDDCAIVKPLGRGWLQLLKTDCVVEGVHFLSDTDAERAGWKAMARAVSDIAAMGGEPQHALVTLLAPPDCAVSKIERLYKGLRKCAARFTVSIIGGETSRASQLAVVVSMNGRVKAACVARRSGARAGDVIFVTGRLGGSLGGHHLDFIPRVAEARWLVTHHRIHAMMDLSDGLGKDLPRMAAASGVDFFIDEKSLPARKGCSQEQAWSDGEDYELLFAVAPRDANKVAGEWAERFARVPLTRIGGFVDRGAGRAPSFQAGGWEHFAK